MSYFNVTDKKPLTPISIHTSLIIAMFRQVCYFFYLNSFNLNKYFVKHSVLVFVCFNSFWLKNKKLKSKQLSGDKSSITGHCNEKLIYIIDITFDINERIFSANEQQKVYSAQKYFSVFV